MPKKALRCSNPTCNHGNGNVLLALEGKRIYVKCRNRDCKRISRITIRIPGIDIDFNSAGIVQEVLPEGYHLDLEPAATVVSE